MTTSAIVLLAGHALLVGTFVVLWRYLPADEATKPRFAGTRLEPLITAAFGTSLLLGVGMIVLGLIKYFR